ncbi:MAG: ornithine carbamoyltransferase, partial [Rhodospirillales bacterium]
MGAERHFLDVSALDTVTLHKIIGRGLAFKGELAAGKMSQPLAGKTLVLIFEKPSTRTRVSFQVGMQQLGGMVVVMSEKESQLGHGETIVDTARVLSRYADAIMIRTDSPQKLAELAAFGSVPVINGLTNES